MQIQQYTIDKSKDAALNFDSCPPDSTTHATYSVPGLRNNCGPIREISFPWKKSIIIKPATTSGAQILIVKRIDDDESTALCLETIKVLASYKTKIYVEKSCLEELKSKDVYQSEFYEYNEEDSLIIDLVIVIGGDEPILWALKYFQNERALPPVLAFGKGTFNYLSNFGNENYKRALFRVMESIDSGKDIEVEERFRLKCEAIDPKSGKKTIVYALNEIVMDRGTNMNIIKLDCQLEGKYFATFVADGVMVATPTGSTAYQLSAGGPIINPLIPSMTITAIAPINLCTRPVVLPSNINLSLKLREDSRKNAYLSADGQTISEITKGMEVNITGSPYPILFILDGEKTGLDNWITRLKGVLGWNRKF